MLRKPGWLSIVIALGGCATIDNGDGPGVQDRTLDTDGGPRDLRAPPPDFWRICEPEFEQFTGPDDPDAFCKGRPDANFYERSSGCTPFYLYNAHGERVASPVCCPGFTCAPPDAKPADGTLCLWHCQ